MSSYRPWCKTKGDIQTMPSLASLWKHSALQVVQVQAARLEQRLGCFIACLLDPYSEPQASIKVG